MNPHRYPRMGLGPVILPPTTSVQSSSNSKEITIPQGSGIMKTKRIGRKHQDTILFDDSALLFEQLHSDPSALKTDKWRIHSLITFGATYCNGIQIIYEINGNIVNGPEHYGSHHSPKKTEYKFEPDEHIIGVKGWCGTWMESAVIITTKRNIQIGERSQSNFSIMLPSGAKAVSIIGGVGGHIHNIGLCYVPLLWSPQTHSHLSIQDKSFVKTVLLVHNRFKNLLSQQQGVQKDINSLIGFGSVPNDILFVIIALCVPTTFTVKSESTDPSLLFFD